MTSSAATRVHSTAYLAAPALLGTYGVVRLLDGQHGPGPGWTTGHLALLGSLLLFGVVMHGLYRTAAARGPVAARVAFGAGLLGLAASLGQVGIDLYVGLRAVDSADKDRLFGQIQSHPGVLPCSTPCCRSSSTSACWAWPGCSRCAGWSRSGARCWCWRGPW